MTQPEAAAVPQDLVAALAEIKRLTAANDAILAEMARHGTGIDMGSMIGQRLFVLLDLLLGPIEGDQPAAARVAYELAVQRQFAQTFTGLQQQVRRNALLQGVNLNGHQPLPSGPLR